MENCLKFGLRRAGLGPDPSWMDGFTEATFVFGGSRSQLPPNPPCDGFGPVAEATLEDERGWTIGSSIDFQRVEDDGDFRLILASPEVVEAAAPICSPEWSCRVEDRVLVNSARFDQGAPAWTLSLEEYRQYAIIHEVGHWLGLGHEACPADGARAPVMQQQSISLEGCRANVWPLPAEWSRVASELDLSLDWDDLLFRGNTGEAVADWQQALNSARSDPVAVDGIYGPETAEATRELQRSQGILVDGIVGSQTRAALDEALE